MTPSTDTLTSESVPLKDALVIAQYNNYIEARKRANRKQYEKIRADPVLLEKRREQNRLSKAKKSAERYQKLKNDPEKLAKKLEMDRISWAKRQAAKGRSPEDLSEHRKLLFSEIEIAIKNLTFSRYFTTKQLSSDIISYVPTDITSDISTGISTIRGYEQRKLIWWLKEYLVHHKFKKRSKNGVWIIPEGFKEEKQHDIT